MIKEWMEGIFYPFRCPLCQKIIVGPKQTVCGACRKKLKKIEEPRCKKCGRPVRVFEQENCPDCERANHFYEEGMGIYLYEGDMRRAVHRMKFQNKRIYAKVFGEMMAEEIGAALSKWEIEAIVPVPMYRRKQRKRGYNQAELLARAIGQIWNIEVKKDWVIRKKDTAAQKDLEKKDRANNMKKAFAIRKNEVELKNILIVDDIYTTGSTVDAVADVLKKHGVQNVYFVSLCIGAGEEDGPKTKAGKMRQDAKSYADTGRRRKTDIGVQ